MQSNRFFTLILVTFLLGLIPAALAHGHDDTQMDMNMKMESHGVLNSTELAGKGWDPEFLEPSYFGHREHAAMMHAHIFLMVLAWIVVLPIGVMLSIARSRFMLPAEFLFLLINASGVITGLVYNRQTPDLYKRNVHHGAGWVITLIAAGWVFLAVVRTYAGRRSKSWHSTHARQAVTHQAMVEHRLLQHDLGFEPARFSNDSGQGTERNTDSLCDTPRHLSLTPENGLAPEWKTQQHDGMDTDDPSDSEEDFQPRDSARGLLSRVFSFFRSPRIQTGLNLIYVVLERLILPMGFFALMSGIVTYGGIFKGPGVFSGVAHFAKGGIFFWYGLLTFGRWMGCFSDLGWAWNIKPGPEAVGRKKSRLPSAEFVESFVIWFYGASNVGLEHLSAWGKAWSAMDLEHISITIMFFGGGLLGMLIESKRIRKFLNTTASCSDVDVMRTTPEWQNPRSYVHSLNPLPALVIMLLGLMMSGHHQSSMVSTMLHKQWGTMFVGFALARGLTYVTFWLKPPTTYLPTRPPSELITSFCLIAGGMIFMSSNRDSVQVLEMYDLDAMFVFTVMMGLTALLMAWTLIVVAIKGWAVRNENDRSHATHNSHKQQSYDP